MLRLMTKPELVDFAQNNIRLRERERKRKRKMKKQYNKKDKFGMSHAHSCTYCIY